MAKRFVSTEIWKEDWYIDMPKDYKLFWHYLLAACDHSGIFKINVRLFNSLNDCSVNSVDALRFFNAGKTRIRSLNEDQWLVEDFFSFQYGSILNLNNKVHESIKNQYNKNNIELTSIRGLGEVKQRVKDKDKDKDILMDKDKVQEKEKEIQKIEINPESINPIKEQVQENIDPFPFEVFWSTYDKKIDRAACERKWNKLSAKEKQQILDYLPKYKTSTPDKNYRRNPETFLNNRSWENEIITQDQNEEKQPVFKIQKGLGK